MKHTIRIGVLLCLAALKGFAQPTQPAGQTFSFTVADCIKYAYEHQDTVVNAALDIRSAEYKVKETTGIGLPQINSSAAFTDYLKIPTTLLPGEFFGAPGTFVPVQFGVKYQSNLGASLSQIVFSGSYLVGLKASRTYKELSQRNYTRSRIEANVQVTKAYYQVLSGAERIRLLDSNIVQLKQTLDQTAAQNKQGFVEKIDVDRLQVQYEDLVTTRENTVRLLALGYQMLKFQMGMPIEANLILKDKLTDINFQENVVAPETDSTLYRNRIEYNLMETQLKLNQLDLQRYKSNYLPSLTAVGNYTYSYQNNSFSNLYKTSFPAAYIGLQLNIPIFSGFQRYYQVKQAQVTVQKTQNDMFQVRNALNLQGSSAKITYINGLQSLNSQKRIREVAAEVLRVARIKYQQGVGSSVEVIQAQQSLTQADDKYVQGLLEALTSKVDLDRVYGRIQ
ncbi:TolC family protein [Mucilaginibacter sp. RS28]|uniref:TolC family protein n=1 Tax=Mucilaginibacter straminoryzae TaxID=2932774 RepID=A0A9X1XB55_9SPHI|nr:TolC family protein [Mucilaginibacter straminoryzae]MCJ8211534.1 TolC family protein [Mucilaginibacter straminoryzae]